VSKQKEVQPYWRPDFKIQATLPDIKVIRTDFIINFFALGLLLLTVFFLLQREYHAYSLRATIEDMERRIRVAEADDKDSLQLSARFRKEAARVVELQRFYSSPWPAHEFLAELAQLKPQDLSFSRVQFAETIAKKGAKLGYGIQIAGDVRELTVLNAFKTALQGSAFFNPEGFVCVVNESMQQRDAKTGIIPFQIAIALNVEAPAAASEGGKK
jgi:hypothetical protein